MILSSFAWGLFLDLLPDDDVDEEGSKQCVNDADKKWHETALENAGLETADDRN